MHSNLKTFAQYYMAFLNNLQEPDMTQNAIIERILIRKINTRNIITLELADQSIPFPAQEKPKSSRQGA